LLRHPEYATALRLACGSAAVASVSSFTLVLLQSRLEFARMARLSAAAAILQILPVLLVLRGGTGFSGGTGLSGGTGFSLSSGWSGVATLFAGDVLSRLWIVAANISLLAAVLGSSPAARPPASLEAHRRIRQLDHTFHCDRLALQLHPVNRAFALGGGLGARNI
jgi:hypothetical protein